MRLILSTLFVVSLLFLGARASAQDGPPPPPPQPKHAPEPPQPPPGPPSPHTGPQPPSAPRPEADPERRKELRRRIQAMRMARLTQILDLDDATAAKLFPALNRHDEKVAALAEERGGLFGKIEAALRSGKEGEAALPPLLDRMAELEKAIHEDDEAASKKVRDALTPVQMAKFLLFNEHFHEEVRAILEEARREGGGDPMSPDAIAARVSAIVDEVSKHLHGNGHPDPDFLAPRFAEFDRLVGRFRATAPPEVQKDVLPQWARWAEAVSEVRATVSIHATVQEGVSLLQAMQQALRDGHPEALPGLNERLAPVAERLKKSGREDAVKQADALLAHAKAALEQAHGGHGGAHGDAPADGLHAIVGRADEREKAADWEGAISELSKAIELEPRNAGLFARRGALRERKGDPPGATADYRKSLELAPDGPQSKEAKAGLERCRAR